MDAFGIRTASETILVPRKTKSIRNLMGKQEDPGSAIVATPACFRVLTGWQNKDSEVKS
jgi:hypothetical protein